MVSYHFEKSEFAMATWLDGHKKDINIIGMCATKDNDKEYFYVFYENKSLIKSEPKKEKGNIK